MTPRKVSTPTSNPYKNKTTIDQKLPGHVRYMVFNPPPKKKCRYLWHFVSRISVGPRASSLPTADPLDVGVQNPTQDASDHQDGMTCFRFRKSQPKPSLATIASWVGEHPKVYLKIRDTPKMIFNAPHSVVHLQVFAPPSE